MSPYRDQDPVDIQDELLRIRCSIAVIAEDVRAMRLASDRRQRWEWPSPPSPALCAGMCAAAMVASIVARAVYP